MGKENKSGLIIQTVAVLGVAAVFTALAFFIPQECDIDKVYLWCRLHPFTVVDGIGATLFYAGCLFLAGLPKWFGIDIGSPTGSSSVNLYAFVGMVVGAILMWA